MASTCVSFDRLSLMAVVRALLNVYFLFLFYIMENCLWSGSIWRSTRGWCFSALELSLSQWVFSPAKRIIYRDHLEMKNAWTKKKCVFNELDGKEIWLRLAICCMSWLEASTETSLFLSFCCLLTWDLHKNIVNRKTYIKYKFWTGGRLMFVDKKK